MDGRSWMGGLTRFFQKSKAIICVTAFGIASSIILTMVLSTAVFAAGSDTSSADLGAGSKRVLFISSYYASFITLKDQTKGLSDTFDKSKIQMDIEYMDIRRMNADGSVQNFYNYLSFKLAHLEKYNAVVVGDDDALQFAMDYKDRLFADLPVVFLGVEDLARAQKAKDIGFTGVVEEHSIVETIRIAQDMMPKATKVVCIYDDTKTGLGDKQNFFQTQEQFPELTFSGINSSQYTFDEVAGKVSVMGRDTILIYEAMFLDKNGSVITIDDAARILTDAASIPVFRTSVGGIGEGVLGGRMISFEKQGAVAAGEVVSILSGTSPKDIPISRDSTYQYIFDMNVLNKFNISPSLLPEDAVIVNAKTDFLAENREILAIAAGILSFAVVIILIVFMDNNALRRVKKDLISSKDQLYDFAYTDPLTGLPNRSHFYKHMNQLFSMSGHEGSEKQNEHDDKVYEIALIYIDIDDFKLINDSRGHRSGDLLLQHMALGLQNLAKENQDFYVARIGGDEFVVVIQNPMSKNATQDLALRIKQIFSSKYSIENTDFYPTASIGIARYPHDTEDAGELVKNADMAMYQAKTEGKNRYAFYESAMHALMEKTMQIQNKIPEALEKERFYLVYQPQVEIVSKKIIGYEALIRWEDPDWGRMSPASFIPIAEKTGQIIPIGNWVLETACVFARKINGDGREPLIISVNISAIQLMQADFFETVVSVIGKTNVPPSWIGLEITETSLINALQQKADVLSRLQQMGFHIILDDFGTGYSSLHYLRELPIEIMKIDQTFTNKLGVTTDNDDLMCLIIEVAHLLKINVVAEGVETKEQLDFLSVNHCDSIQGYFFSHPLPEAEIFEKRKNHEF